MLRTEGRKSRERWKEKRKEEEGGVVDFSERKGQNK